MRLTLLPVLLMVAVPQTVYAQDQALIDAGAAVYETNCSPCHGQRLRNQGGSFDLRELKEDERERFNASVLDGVRMMPPWRGTLADEQLDQLWAYIRAYAYE
jgi:mono/diheme cytochrome c family protein